MGASLSHQPFGSCNPDCGQRFRAGAGRLPARTPRLSEGRAGQGRGDGRQAARGIRGRRGLLNGVAAGEPCRVPGQECRESGETCAAEALLWGPGGGASAGRSADSEDVLGERGAGRLHWGVKGLRCRGREIAGRVQIKWGIRGLFAWWRGSAAGFGGRARWSHVGCCPFREGGARASFSSAAVGLGVGERRRVNF